MLPFELTKDTPYLALSGELWSVFYEYFNRNWPCYKGFLLYNHILYLYMISLPPDMAGIKIMAMPCSFCDELDMVEMAQHLIFHYNISC